MKMTDQLNRLFNEQINKEFYSAYLYLAMSEWLNWNGYPGASAWMMIQYKEEMAHAEGLVRYMMFRGEQIRLTSVNEPEQSWNSALQVFEASLAHEEYVTASINALAGAAEKDNDRAALIFLNWYVLEQVEEENNGNENIRLWKAAKNNPIQEHHVDGLLGARVFQAPVIPYLE